MKLGSIESEPSRSETKEILPLTQEDVLDRLSPEARALLEKVNFETYVVEVGRSKRELLQVAATKNLKVKAWAEDLLDQIFISEPQNLNLIQIDVNDFFVKLEVCKNIFGIIKTSEIYEKMKALGLGLCPGEAVFPLALQVIEKKSLEGKTLKISMNPVNSRIGLGNPPSAFEIEWSRSPNRIEIDANTDERNWDQNSLSSNSTSFIFVVPEK